MAALPLQNVQLIILCSVFLFLAIVVVALRLLTRWIKRAPLVLNDYLIVWALIMLCGEAGIVINAKSIVPIGVHDKSILEALVVREYKTYLASDILWVSIMATIKFSVLDLYLKIFPSIQFRRWIYVIMALNVGWWISIFIEDFTICQPFPYTWDKTIPKGHCGDIKAVYIASAVINVVFDVVVIATPMPMLWRLNMRMGKKIIISGVFALGLVVVIISCLRVQALTLLDLSDLQYNSFYTDLYSVLEPCLATVNACLPVMQPLLAKIASYDIIASIRSSLFSRSHDHSGPGYDQSRENGWRRNTARQDNRTRTNPTQRMYNSTIPLEDYNLTKVSTSTRDTNGLRGVDDGVQVKMDFDVASTKARKNMDSDIVRLV